MKHRLSLPLAFVLSGLPAFAPPLVRAEKPSARTAAAQSPALRSYIREVRNHIGENFQNKGMHNRMMFLRSGGATALFRVNAEGHVEDIRFVNITPKGGNNVAYFARQSILEGSRRFRPFPPELRRERSTLNIRYDFGNVGLRSARHANPDF